MISLVLFVLGAALIVAPQVLHAIVAIQIASFALGVLCWGAAAWFGSYITFYTRASANQAFVRTGKGGAQVFLDNGAYVFPLYHKKIPVSLETMKLAVVLNGRDHALITKDNLRINTGAEFYIKVKPDAEGVLQAARSLGNKSVDATTVEELVREKLVSALRHAAAQMELFDIHAHRDEFAQVVQEHVRRDLSPNGIDLESVTISSLDQLDPGQLSTDNVFDVQGRRKATEITTAQLIETTRLEREAELQIEQKNVETRRAVLELQKQQAQAEAQQSAEITQIKASREREKQEFAIEQSRAIQEAQIAQDISVAAREAEKAGAQISLERDREKARIVKETALQTADETRQQSLEIAKREREIAVAQKEAERERAQAEAVAAQGAREKANQEVLTAVAIAEAQREADVKLTAARQMIEQEKFRRETEIEVVALGKLRNAEIEVETAKRQAEAQIALAEAQLKAKQLEAQAVEAREMVDLTVARESLKVREIEVELERRALENRQTFERVAIQFETTKLEIEARKEVQMAMAKAVGEALAQADFKVYGDPSTMASMLTNLNRGLGWGAMAEGAVQGTPDQVKDLLSQVGGLIQNGGAQELLSQLTGKTATEHTVSTTTESYESNGSGPVI
ncbi:hypothetical protein EON83_01890 [bacterium]|nr:MAG: hypothetical protein EON83_01890 [bacterium]